MGPESTASRLAPVLQLLQELVDAQQALLPVGVAAQDRVIPALHPDRRVQLAADAEPPAGDELEEDLLVCGAAQPAVGKGDGVLAGAPLRAAPLRHPAAGCGRVGGPRP